MKRIVSLLLCIAMLLSFAGCGSEQDPYVPTGDALDSDSPTLGDQTPATPENQDLTMVYYPEESLNPYTATDFTNRALFPLIYQSLFAVERDYTVKPILCSGYSVSDDMKTYTFQVADALFSDGTKLTAADAAASLEAAKNGSYYSGRFLHIRSIAVENETVVITLDTPMENLPLLLDIPIVKAEEVNAESPLGTGPYVLDRTGSSARLRRQTAWWCINQVDLIIHASSIPLVEAESPSHIRDQFEFADVGLVCADPGSDTYASYRCDYEVWDSENGLFLYLGCNAESQVLSNDSIRQALTYAIDRDLLVDTYYRGFAYSATLPASPLSACYNTALAEKYSYNSQKLTDALTEANMQGAAVTLLLNSDDSLRLRAGRAIAEMLRVCGLEVTVNEVNSKNFKAALKAGEYDLYLGQTKLSPNMDLTAFYKQKGALSYGGMSDIAIYAMVLEALANQGNFYNLHQMVMEDAQLCPILFRSYAVYATRGLVTDLTPSRDNIFCYDLGLTMEDILQ